MQKLKATKRLNTLNSEGLARYSVGEMTSKNITKTPQAGFTMVELLAVIMVIGILAGMVLGIAGIATKKAASAKAKAMFGQIEMALAEYYAENKTYPLTDSYQSLDLWSGDDGDLYKKLRPYVGDDKGVTGGNTTYASAKLVDPWGRNVKYRAAHPNDTSFKNSMNNPETYDLLMTGADGVEYTGQSEKSDDDIKNW